MDAFGLAACLHHATTTNDVLRDLCPYSAAWSTKQKQAATACATETQPLTMLPACLKCRNAIRRLIKPTRVGMNADAEQVFNPL